MIVSLNNIMLRRGDLTILKDVSWQIKQDEHWCLFGLNGSGKTTLLNIINGYLWPTVGQVEVFNKKFGQVDLRELRKKIGWVSSSISEKFPINGTVFKIILGGKFATIGLYDEVTDDDRKKAQQLLQQLSITYLADRDYRVLSHGEKQRVLIARALMADPKLLILDEPCTGLDFIARENLLETIEKLAKTKDDLTLIYVTHHVEEILPCFSKSLLLKDGQVFSIGNTAEQFTSTNLTNFFNKEVETSIKNERFNINLL